MGGVIDWCWWWNATCHKTASLQCAGLVTGHTHPPPRLIENLVFLIALEVSYFGRDIYNLVGVFSRFPITFLVTRLAAHLTSYKLSYIYLTTF